MEVIQVGKHRVRHGDIMQSLDDLLQGEKTDIFYCDPPWGEGNLKYWGTIARKDGEEVHQAKLTDFLDRLFYLIITSTKQDAMIFIEYGLRWEQTVISFIHDFGLKLLCISDPVYGSKKLPLKLFTIAKTNFNIPCDYQQSIANTAGMNTLYAAMDPFYKTGMTIFDPCCGVGNTARFAVSRGLTFYGNELNMKRLQSTIRILGQS